MFKCITVCVFFVVSGVLAIEVNDRKPVYKYRYETEDLMKTAASSVPVHGYHTVEGGYYPQDGLRGGFNNGFGNSGGFGGQSFGQIGGGFSPIRGGLRNNGGIGYGSGLGYGGGLRQGGYYDQGPIGGGGGLIGTGGGLIGGGGHIGGGHIGGGHIGSSLGNLGGGSLGPIYSNGHGHGHHGHGGEYVDKNVYGGEKKHLNDESFEKSSGNKQEEGKHGQDGYQQEKVALKNVKGDTGFYNDEEGVKKVFEDGKSYDGAEHTNQEAKSSGENKEKKGHKKGHVIKGFKTSHHKDESGKTEEFYDEENDEGDNYNFKGQNGAFGEQAKSSFKGGHENGHSNVNQSKKQGHHDSEHVVDNANQDQGQYGQKKYSSNGQTFGVNNGVDQQSLLGTQENSRFYKHHPYHTPYY